MARVRIDGCEVDVAEGTTVLAAARQLGIEIPTLCFREGLQASTSCMTCQVRIGGSRSLVPSCATVVADGMDVESESEQVRAARRTSLELLLSDHAGDCVAPCQLADDRHADIPRFLRQLGEGDVDGAAATLQAAGFDLDCVKEGDVRRAQKACRRGRHDESVAIERLVRYVAAARSSGSDAAGDGGVPPYREYSVRLGKMTKEEMAELLAGASGNGQVQPVTEGYTADEARAEAQRCMHCDCRAAHSCRLRDACEQYGVTNRLRVQRPVLEQDRTHPDILHEPGKCIRCGLCLQVAERAGERLGLAFAGRGFDMRVKVPFGVPLSQALEMAGEECAEVCPTAALARLLDQVRCQDRNPPTTPER